MEPWRAFTAAHGPASPPLRLGADSVPPKSHETPVSQDRPSPPLRPYNPFTVSEKPALNAEPTHAASLLRPAGWRADGTSREILPDHREPRHDTQRRLCYGSEHGQSAFTVLEHDTRFLFGTPSPVGPLSNSGYGGRMSRL